MESIGTVSPVIPLGVHHFETADAGRILQCVINPSIAHHYDLRFLAGGSCGLAIDFGDLHIFTSVSAAQRSISSLSGGFAIDKYSPISIIPSLPFLLAYCKLN